MCGVLRIASQTVAASGHCWPRVFACRFVELQFAFQLEAMWAIVAAMGWTQMAPKPSLAIVALPFVDAAVPVVVSRWGAPGGLDCY